MSNKYFGRWSGYKEMLHDWQYRNYDYVTNENKYSPLKDPIPTKDEVLFASYGTEGYEGYATVFFEKDGVLFEVSGSHCSCNDLEGQWAPDSVTWDALEMRIPGMERGTYGFLHAHEKAAREAFIELVQEHRPYFKA